MSTGEAAKVLQQIVEDVQWSRNTGTGAVDMTAVDALTESANALLGQPHLDSTEPDLGAQLVAAVARISYQLQAREPDNLAGLPARLLQAMKVQEEAGELAAALIGVTGQNPRKGVTHTWHDAVLEAVDVAMSALVFIETVEPGRLATILGERLDFLQRRAAQFGAPDIPSGR